MTAVPFTKIIKGMTAVLGNRKENGCLGKQSFGTTPQTRCYAFARLALRKQRVSAVCGNATLVRSQRKNVKIISLAL